MKNQKTCPHSEGCVISAVLKTIDIPRVLGYCSGSWENCRYLPRTERRPDLNRQPETVGV